ncbi:hypothetical protein RHO15_06440 [Utexia brackfieldae]|uniref:hypothetical protein n=1 Tax=Utexia brackfieldae TaxID=3074108 RepID=UPI00370DC475
MEDLDKLIFEKRIITNYLFEDAQNLNLNIKELSPDIGNIIIQKAIKKFIDPQKGPLLCYGIISPYVSASFPDEWGIIGELQEVPENFFVFFDSYKDNHVIEINKISDFGKLVEETIVFTYYIVNKDLDFLIAWDAAHQVLIGTGKAQNWIKNLIKRRSDDAVLLQ